MKKSVICLFLCLCLIVFQFSFISNIAYADGLSAFVIGGLSYTIGQQIGLTFSMTGATAQQTQVWMGNQIDTYTSSSGKSLAEAFGDQVFIDSVGKIAIGHITYNGICDFLTWLKQTYDLDANIKSLNDMIGEYTLDHDAYKDDNLFTYNDWTVNNRESGSFWGLYWVNSDGVIQGSRASVSVNTYPIFAGYTIKKTGSRALTAYGRYTNSLGGTQTQAVSHTFDSVINSANISSTYFDTGFPTVLYPDKEWTGTIGGQDWPDTNLDQLMGQVYQDVADNNLDVEGEVIDVPVPTPTPMPIDPDTPLQDVPWEGLDNNLQQLYEQGLEEIGTIGEARDAITDAVGEQTGALEDAIADNAGVVSGAIDQAVSDVGTAIGTQTGVISGAIDQAVSDVQTAIGEQTAVLDESLSATAEGVETIAEAIEDEAINWQKFDLRGLFPFCIPFDIYNMLKALDASPTAPHVQLPFVIQSLGFSYLIDLDFSAFDSVAAIMRQMELICYGLALAWATSKVIKW